MSLPIKPMPRVVLFPPPCRLGNDSVVVLHCEKEVCLYFESLTNHPREDSFLKQARRTWIITAEGKRREKTPAFSTIFIQPLCYFISSLDHSVLFCMYFENFFECFVEEISLTERGAATVFVTVPHFLLLFWLLSVAIKTQSWAQ